MPFYVAGSRSTIVWEAEEAIFKSANIGRNEPINSSDSIWKVVAGIFKVVQFGIFYYSRKKRVWQIYSRMRYMAEAYCNEWNFRHNELAYYN